MNVIAVQLPSLRERKEDIPLLVQHFLDKYAEESRRSGLMLTPEAMDRLAAYDWPGNVRELVHVIQRAAVLGGEVIDVASLPEALRTRASKHPTAPSITAPTSLRDAIADLEKRMIVEALDRAKGNRSEAARQLGIGRPQLYAKMEEHGLAAPKSEKE